MDISASEWRHQACKQPEDTVAGSLLANRHIQAVSDSRRQPSKMLWQDLRLVLNIRRPAQTAEDSLKILWQNLCLGPNICRSDQRPEDSLNALATMYLVFASGTELGSAGCAEAGESNGSCRGCALPGQARCDAKQHPEPAAAQGGWQQVSDPDITSCIARLITVHQDRAGLTC